MKVLLLKPSSLGDVVHALPVLRLLKLHLPHAQVYWWINAELVPLLEHDPDLAGLFPFQRRGWASLPRWHARLEQIQEMRSHRFDWVIDLQGLARSAIHAWLARGDLTIGLDSGREGAVALYDLAVPRPAPDSHAVDWYLAAAAQLGIPTNRPFDWLPAPANPTPPPNWQSGHRWITLVPGARWLNKRWPAESFAKVVKQLSRQHSDLRFAIIGSSSDHALGATIQAANPGTSINLAGATSLPEMIEWLRRSELCITNDTGPMHLAAALRRPVVALFGPTNPARTGPYQQLHRVLRVPLPCAPCLKASCSRPIHMECLHALTPETVVAHTHHLLAIPAPNSPTVPEAPVATT